MSSIPTLLKPFAMQIKTFLKIAGAIKYTLYLLDSEFPLNVLEQVAWDEPDLLQNVKRVNPWLVELVANMPPIHLSPFSPPRKKLRLPQPLEFPTSGQFSLPSLLSNPLIPSSPLSCVSDNIPAGIQGARHAQFGLSLTDLHFNKLQGGLFPFGYREFDRTISPKTPSGSLKASSENDDNLSCLLTIGNTSPNFKQNNEKKTQKLMLFGKAILTEQQMSQSCSGETVGNSLSYGNREKTVNLSGNSSGSALLHSGPTENSSDELSPWYKDQKSEFGLETGHCKVFMESDDVGRTLDLSALSSYEELYRKLATMFGIQRSEMLSNVLYQDTTGSVRHTGDEPFR